MAKRFTETRKWSDAWFRNLKPAEKCFWVYILDTCDHAGIWPVDFDLAAFCIGTKLDETALRLSLKDRFFEIDDDSKWVIVNFIPFQYTKLTKGSNNRVHDSVWAILEAKGLRYPYKDPPKPLDRGKEGPKDKDKDKDKDRKDYKGICQQEARKGKKQ